MGSTGDDELGEQVGEWGPAPNNVPACSVEESTSIMAKVSGFQASNIDETSSTIQVGWLLKDFLSNLAAHDYLAKAEEQVSLQT